MGVFLYDFNGTDTSSGIPAPAGHPPLEQIYGAWRRLSNRAYTSTDNDLDPILAITEGTGDCEVSANISPTGGDCLYARVVDANNWIRLRSHQWRTSYQYTYYVTEYEIANVEGSPTQYEWAQSYECFYEQDGYEGQLDTVEYAWNSSSSNPPYFPSVTTESHYGYAYSGWQNDGSDAYWNGDQYDHTHYEEGSPYRTGNTSGGYYVSYYYWSTSSDPDGGGPDYWTGSTRSSPRTGTGYEYHHGLVLEKCVNGTVTVLDSVEVGADPTSIRLRCEGSNLSGYYNGGSTAVVSAVDATHSTTGRQGIGRGPSDYDGQALDNMQVDTLNVRSNAPGLVEPADDAKVPRAIDLHFAWDHDDPDGDPQAGFDLEYRKVGDAAWTVIHQDTASEFYDLPGYTLDVSTPYEWRVRTYDAGGPGPYSAVRTFTTIGYGDVIVGGQVKQVAQMSVIVGGVKRPVMDVTAIVGGVQKILT